MQLGVGVGEGINWFLESNNNTGLFVSGVYFLNVLFFFLLLVLKIYLQGAHSFSGKEFFFH